MKTKLLLSLIVVGILALSGAAFGGTITITGKVLAVTDSIVTVQSGSDVWEINRKETTKITGDLKVGATVTVSCNEPDAQKKEAPAAPSQSPTKP